MLPASAGRREPRPRAAVGSAPASAGRRSARSRTPRLAELSGLVGDRRPATSWSTTAPTADRATRVFFWTSDCKVTQAVDVLRGRPATPQDLALSPDGKTLWVADTGDNVTERAAPERSRCGAAGRRAASRRACTGSPTRSGTARRRGPADRRRRQADHHHQVRPAAGDLRPAGPLQTDNELGAAEEGRASSTCPGPAPTTRWVPRARALVTGAAGRRTAARWCCAPTPTRSSGTCRTATSSRR